MALIIRQLSKRYGAQVALHDVDLTLQEGVVALLGANGSGKSTLLRTLATLSKPDSGEIIFDGQHYGRHERQLRSRIGYLPQDFEIPDTLTPRKFLHYLASLRGGQAHKVLKLLALESLADRPVKALSAGELRLVGVAQALLGTPRLLLLDELTRGLDFMERERIFRLIVQQGRLVIFSTHILEDVEQIAQTVVVLHQGQVLFCGTPEHLRELADNHVYEMCATPEALPRFVSTALISRITPKGSYVLLRIIGQLPSGEAISVAPTLQDAYLWLMSTKMTKLSD